MNIRKSGNFPDKIRSRACGRVPRITAALALALVISLNCGCKPPDASSTDISSDVGEISEISSASSEDTTHQPESSSEEPDNTESSDSSCVSDDIENSGEESSGTGEPEESSGCTELSSTSEEAPPESSLESAASSEPIIEIPPEPPEVIIPDFVLPTSPGTDIAVAENGAVDYSNASQGYISAQYTGGSGKAKLRIICGDKEYVHDLDVYGSTVYLPLSCGSGEYSVTLLEQIEGDRYALVLEDSFYADISYSVSPFLYPNMYVNYYSGSNCVYKAAELCAGKTGTIEKVAAVFGWVTSNITYDHDLAATVVSGYIPDPDRTLANGKGICFDYSSLMAAMLRSQLIPTRLVIGYASPNIYHAWNEIYTEETGWITPELLLKNAGYNIADATFYASAGDKAQIGSYISNGANYSALYYY